MAQHDAMTDSDFILNFVVQFMMDLSVLILIF